MQSVLVVEDCLDAVQLIKKSLGQLHLRFAQTLREARALIETIKFDLILLDVLLPDGDSFGLCSVLQKSETYHCTPVMFLTAQDSVADKVLAFSVGADDYVTKPFDLSELRARVEARLRKRKFKKQKADVVELGGLTLDRDRQKVFVDSVGAPAEVALTATEYRLLAFLMAAPSQAYTRDEILNGVWGHSVHVYHRCVDTHISKLRRKLGQKAHYIRSAHGKGYCFSLPERGREVSADSVSANAMASKTMIQGGSTIG